MIAITGGKGGVGKSLIATNLSLILSKLNRKVLMFDADFSLSNIEILLGINPKYNLTDVLKGHITLQDVLVNVVSNLDVVPVRNSGTELLDLSLKTNYALSCALADLSINYDYIMLDIASGLSKGLLHFSAAAHEVIVVVVNEPTSIADAYAVIKLLNKRYNIKSYQILVNMIRYPLEADEVFAKLIKVTEKFLDVNLHKLGALPYDMHAVNAVKAQKAVVDVFPNSRFSRELVKLGHKIVTITSRCEVIAPKFIFR